MARTVVTFELDAAGIREFLQGPEVHAMVDGAAADVAARVRAQVPGGVPVEVRPYRTDRDAAGVTVADVRAMGWQARDGLLTGAAGAAGMEVKERGG